MKDLFVMAFNAPLMAAVLDTRVTHWEVVPWVLLGLVVLMLVVRGLGMLALPLQRYFELKTAEQAQLALHSPVIPGIEPEVLAVIHAAIAVAEPGPFHIVSVHSSYAVDPSVRSSGILHWAHEGRRQIYSSHQLR